MSEKPVNEKNGFVIEQPLTRLFLGNKTTIDGYLISFWVNLAYLAKVFTKEDQAKKVAIKLLPQMRTGASLEICRIRSAGTALLEVQLIDRLVIVDGVIKDANDRILTQ